ncbi:hypothetical protein LCGC14_2962570, partial [marine sediment metagenome]
MAKRTYIFWEDKLKAALKHTRFIEGRLVTLTEDYLAQGWKPGPGLRYQVAKARRKLRQLNGTKIPYYRERLLALRPS